MSSGAVKTSTKKSTKAKSTKTAKDTASKVKPTVEAATNEAVKKPRTKTKYACYILPNVTVEIINISDEAKASIREKITAAMADTTGLINGGNCSGVTPSLAASKKAKIAAANNSNIVILRPLSQFRTFFTYAAQRVQVRELDYQLDDQGRKVSATDKKTGQPVAGITRRIKGSADSANLVTSTYWSEFDNKSVSLGRIKFDKKPAAFVHHKKSDDDKIVQEDADDAQE